MAVVFDSFQGLQTFLTTRLHTTVFSGVGISNRSDNTTILRLVDSTPYYLDEILQDGDRLRYTLFGKIGDQDPEEARFNRPFLRPGRQIYAYSVSGEGADKRWIWMGRYRPETNPNTGETVLERRTHPDQNGALRTIYRVELVRVGF